MVQDKVKQLCKKANKPFVLASLGSKRTVLELKAKGVLKEKHIHPHSSHVGDHVFKSNPHEPDLVAIVSNFLNERETLLAQEKGLEQQLSIIRERLKFVDNELDIIRKRLGFK